MALLPLPHIQRYNERILNWALHSYAQSDLEAIGQRSSDSASVVQRAFRHTSNVSIPIQALPCVMSPCACIRALQGQSKLTRCVRRGCGGAEGLSRTKLHQNHTSEVHLTICGRWAARRTTKLCLPPRVYNSHKLHVAAADTACSASPSPYSRRTAPNLLLRFRSAHPPA